MVRTLGCFVKMPDEKRTSKFNPKGMKGTLVGYTDMGYKTLIENKIVISRHVIFIDPEADVVRFEMTDEEQKCEEKNMNEEANKNGIKNNQLKEICDTENEEFYDTIEDEEDMRKKVSVEELSGQSRPKRERKLPKKFDDHVVYVNVCDAGIPETYEEAINSSELKKWKNAMNDEINSLKQNETWEIVDEPLGKNLIEVKCIYRIKSTTGIILRVYNNPVLWKTQKQKIVSRASTHAEYYALADCVTEVLPVKGVLNDRLRYDMIFLDIDIKKLIKIYEDSSGAIALSKNGKFCKNSKHIDVSYHFITDYEKKGVMSVIKVNTADQLADILTKALGKNKFQYLRNLINVY